MHPPINTDEERRYALIPYMQHVWCQLLQLAHTAVFQGYFKGGWSRDCCARDLDVAFCNIPLDPSGLKGFKTT